MKLISIHNGFRNHILVYYLEREIRSIKHLYYYIDNTRGVNF